MKLNTGSSRRPTTTTRASPMPATRRRQSMASGHPLYYDNVLRVLRGEDEPETDGREGLKSLEVLIACYLAARDGRRVSLPLEY